MQFIVENEPFAKALGLVKACVPARSTIPILSHIVVEAKAGVVTVRATNMEREIEASVKAEVTSEGGAALPGEILTGLVRRLAKGGQSSFAVDAKERCKIVSGSGQYDLRVLPFKDYPSPKAMRDGVVKFGVDAAMLSGLIASTIYAASPECPHSYGRGVHLHVAAAKLIAVTCDNHRVARRSMPMPKGSATMPPVTIPVEDAQALLGFLDGANGEVELAISSALIELCLPGLRFASPLVDCKFPDYDKVIPKPDDNHGASFRPYALSEAIGRATTVYLGEKKSVGPQLAEIHVKNNAIKLDAGIKGQEMGSETVEADTNGMDLRVSVNAGYLDQMLKIWPESVAVDIWQKQAYAPVLFSSKERDDQVHVLMPQKG